MQSSHHKNALKIIRFSLFICGLTSVCFILSSLCFSFQDTPDMVNLLINGMLAMITLYLAFIFFLSPAQKSGYLFLISGLVTVYTTLIFSMCLAIFIVPEKVDALIRGGLFFIGYLLVVVGMKQWLSYTAAFEKKLIQQNHTDELTGLPNRRALIQYFKDQKTQPELVDEECSFILIDINNFKQVNDLYGHISADLILKEFTGLLRRQFNTNAFISRWSGDEFAVVLIGVAALDAGDLVEKTKAEVNRYVFDYQKNQVRLSVSIGLIGFYVNESFATSILRKATLELQKSKKKL